MTTTSPPQHGVTPVKHEASPRSREGRRFPGWRWVAVWLAFPVAGYIGWIVGGRVDAVRAALVGGALTGAGIGAVQWWAADGALGRPAGWIAASAVGFAVGLTAARASSRSTRGWGSGESSPGFSEPRPRKSLVAGPGTCTASL
jgi:hypothetical protein